MPLLGAHMPTSGGLEKAFDRLRTIGGRAMQIFTRNQRQWNTPPISDEEAAAFAAAWNKWNERGDEDDGDNGGRARPYVASHASYLINPATPDPELGEKSVTALAAELVRCRVLGIEHVTLHPGAHVGSGEEQGLAAVARRLDQAFARFLEATGLPQPGLSILLENTAGQGTALGASFEHIAAIMETVRFAGNLGMCFDTCHAHAAGHDMRTPEGYAAVMDSLDRLVGLDRVRLFHLNDSKNSLASRKDRHEHIGQGELGKAPFVHLLNDPRFADRPMVLETPKNKDLAEDISNLATLRSLLR